MKANKTHISLETAKLLKDCGVESEYVWIHHYFATFEQKPKLKEGWSVRKATLLRVMSNELLPAYTWQEILWENAEEFFGKEHIMKERNQKVNQPALFFAGHCYLYYSIIILDLLQQKKYDEADKYFRDNCKLIKI